MGSGLRKVCIVLLWMMTNFVGFFRLFVIFVRNLFGVILIEVISFNWWLIVCWI